MKKILLPLLMVANTAIAQRWEAEAQAGIAGYSGDLNVKTISFRNMGPGIAANARYYFNYMFGVRAGLSWGQASGNDKYNNKSPELLARNLNFKTSILEANVCMEVNILSPDMYTVYPYVFAGVGAFHFNPYSTSENGQKVYLQPLGTEGQDLPQYPDKKKYSLTQLCIPFGGGVRMKINDQWDAGFEIGFRKLFTDYLDDVSGRYANPEILITGRGALAYEMAYRGSAANIPQGGEIRGNPKKKDWYYFTGIKLIWKFVAGDQEY
jgi:Outer membrane protein beta-barrel domain